MNSDSEITVGMHSIFALFFACAVDAGAPCFFVCGVDAGVDAGAPWMPEAGALAAGRSA